MNWTSPQERDVHREALLTLAPGLFMVILAPLFALREALQ